MMKRFVAVYAVFMLVIAVFGTALAQQPEFRCSVSMFLEGYNASAPKMNLASLSPEDGKPSSEITTSFVLSEFSIAMLFTNPGRKSLTGSIFVGTGNGTPESGAIIMASSLAYLYGIFHFEDKEAVNGLFTEMMESGLESGKKFTKIVGSIQITASVDRTTGFKISATSAKK